MAHYNINNHILSMYGIPVVIYSTDSPDIYFVNDITSFGFFLKY